MKPNQSPAFFFSPPSRKTIGPYSHDAWPIATANLHAYDSSREVLHVDSVGCNVVSMYVFSIVLQLKKALLKCLFSFFCDG